MYMNLKPNKHKIISFSTTTMTSLGFIIVVTPPPPFIKGGWRGVQNFLLESGDDKPVKGGGGCHFFITLQFNHIYFV